MTRDRCLHCDLFRADGRGLWWRFTSPHQVDLCKSSHLFLASTVTFERYCTHTKVDMGLLFMLLDSLFHRTMALRIVMKTSFSAELCSLCQLNDTHSFRSSHRIARHTMRRKNNREVLIPFWLEAHIYILLYRECHKLRKNVRASYDKRWLRGRVINKDYVIVILRVHRHIFLLECSWHLFG